MTKKQFTASVAERLKGLSQSDIDKSLEFYEEMIADRMEDGATEEEAVGAMGDPDDVARQILMDMPLPKVLKVRTASSRKLKPWEILLLILGAPLWIPLLAAAVVIFISVYVVIWVGILSLWVADVALAAGALTGLALFGVMLGAGSVGGAFFFLGMGFLLAGIAIFAFIGCKALTVLIVKLSVLIWRTMKSIFVGKGERS